MGIIDHVRKIAAQHEAKRLDKLDGELAGLIFTPDPSHLPRIIRTPHIEQPGEAYLIEGKMWADGKARLVTGMHTRVREELIEWPDA